MKNNSLFLLFVVLVSCTMTEKKSSELPEEAPPGDSPISFLPELVGDSLIIHRGIFSNDLETYYYTVSDQAFSNFTIKSIHRSGNQWTPPDNAFFNSPYDDHGMSFSPDGNTLVFSSTRPIVGNDTLNMWHLWKCENEDGVWTEPEYIEIPNLKSQLTSHPTLAPDGTLYFHASNLDYSGMAIYRSALIDGKYQSATKMDFEDISAFGFCTPYVSADGNYLIFAAIGESLELYRCEMERSGEWSSPVALPSPINQNGQGNPYVTPDSKYLFFAKENESKTHWDIQWVSTSSFLR